MTIKSAITLFESLQVQSQKKQELKIYKEFIVILKAIENRKMTEVEIQSIETFLIQLELNALPNNKRKYFRRKLRAFKEYLKKEFSLTTKGYYATLGTGLGMSFGIAIGAAFFKVGSGVSIGMLFGMFFGLIVGRFMDSEAEKENRVLH